MSTYFTGSTDSAEMEAFLLAGVNLVLFKPVKSSELAHVMDGLLGRTPGRSVVFCSNRMGVQVCQDLQVCGDISC